MAVKDYGQTYYAEDSTSFSLSDITESIAESLEGRTVRSFTSTAARDTALATLTTPQKLGVVAHVQGKGLYYYTGSEWKYLSAYGENFVQSGFGSGTTEANGLFRVNFSPVFAAAPVVVLSHMQNFLGGTPLHVSLYTEAGYLTADRFHVRVVTMSGTVAAGVGVGFSWIAHGQRGSE